VTEALTPEAVRELARARGLELGPEEAAEVRDRLESIRAALEQARARLGAEAAEPAVEFEAAP